METFDTYGFGEMDIEQVKDMVSQLFSINFSPRNGENFGEYYNAEMLMGEFTILNNVSSYDGSPLEEGFGTQRTMLEVTQIPDSDFVMACLLDNCPSAVVMVHDVYPDEADDP